MTCHFRYNNDYKHHLMNFVFMLYQAAWYLILILLATVGNGFFSFFLKYEEIKTQKE